ncbi:MAG: deoxyribose-phosphate aldolase [Candidatus Zixiibacteriota bacterium]|nr:MAG: deoxyribose-phosphate aldolase [candidate division Zixibacteria bacterium]
MEELSGKIGEIKTEIESQLNISIPLWFELSGDTADATVSDAELASRLPGMIDHTLLRPDADSGEIKRLCEDAEKYGFYSVCIYSPFVGYCSEILEGSDVRVCSVAGFPSGAFLPRIKALEAREAVLAGADEIDTVINISALKENELTAVYDDIRAVVKAVSDDTVIKVILETGYLNEDEKIKGCILAQTAGANFVKTSTGFGPSGASVDDVRLMRAVVGPEIGVKAAGGIRDAAGAISMVKAGAARIGTSASINIVTGIRRMVGPNCLRRGN